jgi:hypothetical protein
MTVRREQRPDEHGPRYLYNQAREAFLAADTAVKSEVAFITSSAALIAQVVKLLGQWPRLRIKGLKTLPTEIISDTNNPVIDPEEWSRYWPAIKDFQTKLVAWHAAREAMIEAWEHIPDRIRPTVEPLPDLPT